MSLSLSPCSSESDTVVALLDRSRSPPRFPITGVMESTGVLQPRDELRKVEEFDWLRTDILAENKRWLYVVYDKATSRVSSVQERTNKGDRESLATLQHVERQTLIEIGKGHMGQPWSLSDLLAAYTNLADGSLRCRSC